jgi:hypothetical protein
VPPFLWRLAQGPIGLLALASGLRGEHSGSHRGARNFDPGVHVGATNSIADDNSFVTGGSGLTGAPGPSYDGSSHGATGGDALGAAGGETF